MVSKSRNLQKFATHRRVDRCVEEVSTWDRTRFLLAAALSMCHASDTSLLMPIFHSYLLTLLDRLTHYYIFERLNISRQKASKVTR